MSGLNLRNIMFENNDYFDFNITNYCNAGCPTCKRYSMPVNPHVKNEVKEFLIQNRVHMNFDDFKKILFLNEDLFFGKGAQFCGEFGDPLMHPKIEDFTIFSCKFFRTLKINTNAGLKRKKYFENVSHLKNKLVMYFGIDGTTDEINNKYRIGVNTKTAFENMNLWKKLKCEPQWDYIVFQHNIDDVENALNYAIDNRIQINLKINLRETYREIRKITKDQFKKIQNIVYEKNDKIITFQDYYE